MIRNYIKFVWDQFINQKLRFILTISGIIIGTCTLPVLASFLTVGSALLQMTSRQASGDDVLSVRNDWKLFDTYPNERRLSREDFSYLEKTETLSNLSFTPEYGPSEKKIVFEGKEFSGRAMGITSKTLSDHQLELKDGRTFSNSDFSEFHRVAIVGSKILKEFKEPWLHKKIRIKGEQFTIVGVLFEKPALGKEGRWGWNNRVLLPYTTYNILYNTQKAPQTIVGKVVEYDKESGILKALDVSRILIDHILMQDRKYKIFEITGLDDSTNNVKTILFVIKVLVLMTTIFSLIVGGINIMNIMLVTVTERTREIGIRRALGANRKNILLQFLIESIFLTLTGTIIGLIFALGGLQLLSIALTKFLFPWPFHIVWWSVGLSLGITIIIGIVFGLSPALKASRLEPVEALRYD